MLGVKGLLKTHVEGIFLHKGGIGTSALCGFIGRESSRVPKVRSSIKGNVLYRLKKEPAQARGVAHLPSLHNALGFIPGTA